MAPAATPRPRGLVFINTARPGDATTAATLSQIRSHATREMRQRRRRQKQQQQQQMPSRRPSPRVVAPKPANSDVMVRRPAKSAATPMPFVLLSDWRPARQLTEAENFLLHHYVNFVIPIIGNNCHKGAGLDLPRFIEGNCTHWVPFALSEPGVMSGLFLQACRSLEKLTGATQAATLALEYRLQCIRAVNASLSDPAPATWSSDATISLVMIMASDEFLVSNIAAWRAHIAAAHHLIRLRGGLDALGVGGYLKKFVLGYEALARAELKKKGGC